MKETAARHVFTYITKVNIPNYLCFKCPNLLDQNAQMRYGLDIQTLPDTHNTFFLQQNAGQGEITLTQNIHT